MARKKKEKVEFKYSKNESFENLEAVQQMALNRKGKLCWLYSEKEKSISNVNLMGSVKIDGHKLHINVGESVEIKDD